MWMPIETAPKDGTIVDVGTGKGDSPTWWITGRFVNGRWCSIFNGKEWKSFDPQPKFWRSKK